MNDQDRKKQIEGWIQGSLKEAQALEKRARDENREFTKQEADEMDMYLNQIDGFKILYRRSQKGRLNNGRIGKGDIALHHHCVFIFLEKIDCRATHPV